MFDEKRFKKKKKNKYLKNEKGNKMNGEEGHVLEHLLFQ